MASTSTKAAVTKSILKMTLKGHVDWVGSISYFPDGQRMISGSRDKTARRWDLKAGKEIEKVRGICEEEVQAVAVSRDGRWVVTGGGGDARPELKACEVETGIVKTLQGHSDMITCIDVSADSKLLASGSGDETARIWNLETGELVAGPFKSVDWVGAVRFSTDLKKLAIKSYFGQWLEVWDVETQKLDVSIGRAIKGPLLMTSTPIFWTNKNKNILAAFNFTIDYSRTIYEFDASTLKTVGTPFKGHNNVIYGLALSFDGTLLASSSWDHTIKLWAFESRQLLASFDVQNPDTLVLSPDSCQFAYTTFTGYDDNIYICNTPPEVLAQACTSARTLNDLLNSDATRRPPAVRRRLPIPDIPMVQRPPPTIDPQQTIFLRLRKLLPFSSRTNAIPSVRNNIQSRGPLDFPATSPLPSNHLYAESPPSTSFKLPGGRAFFNTIQSSSKKGKQKARERKRKPAKVIDVPLGQATYGDAVGVDDGNRPFVLLFCLSWFQKKEKRQVPRPVYDDDPEDDEEEEGEDILNRVAVSPPRVQYEEIEMNIMATSQSQPEAGPSHLAVIDEHVEGQSS
ncbi:hypothetical protein DEU56DRAFT_983807 [Suillus clintonianus]|uniref:uncharacterized protein n=1 Tax=Suillus clintonianus TaxID=1904413 RepID=UPI001B886666|nr:uncharacterized protein DEU56DRAFT_983807 [Suillus clintonianus]KAG2123454.1 hypothetical protein DEU56DRAFT_983807 [Suillus clintonianus]